MINKWWISVKHLRDGKIGQSVIEDKYDKPRTTRGRIEELVSRQYQDNKVEDHIAKLPDMNEKNSSSKGMALHEK